MQSSRFHSHSTSAGQTDEWIRPWQNPHSTKKINHSCWGTVNLKPGHRVWTGWMLVAEQTTCTATAGWLGIIVNKWVLLLPEAHVYLPYFKPVVSVPSLSCLKACSLLMWGDLSPVCNSEEDVCAWLVFEGVIHTTCVPDIFSNRLMRAGVTLSSKMGVCTGYCVCWATRRCAMTDSNQCDLAVFKVTVGFPVNLHPHSSSLAHILSFPLLQI